MKKLLLIGILSLIGCSSTAQLSTSSTRSQIKKAEICALVIKSQYWDNICESNESAKDQTARTIELFHKMGEKEKEGTLDLLFSREQRLWYHRTKIQLMIYFEIYE